MQRGFKMCSDAVVGAPFHLRNWPRDQEASCNRILRAEAGERNPHNARNRWVLALEPVSLDVIRRHAAGIS